MTPEAQQIAIAEFRGWEFEVGYPQQLARNEAAGIPWQYINGQHCADGTTLKGVPDYLNDLNAIHEAHEAITYEQHISYRHHLQRIVYHGPTVAGNKHRSTSNATAGQRAEALLRALNLWKE